MGLREIRKLRGLTQFRLAAKVGVTRTTIARIETGARHASPVLIKKIAEALDLSPYEAWDAFYGEDAADEAKECNNHEEH